MFRRQYEVNQSQAELEETGGDDSATPVFGADMGLFISNLYNFY